MEDKTACEASIVESPSVVDSETIVRRHFAVARIFVSLMQRRRICISRLDTGLRTLRYIAFSAPTEVFRN